MTDLHQPVLFEQAIEGLRIKPGGIYIDGTFGRGGHSSGILARLGSQGRLLALDKDPRAIQAGQQGVFNDPRFCILHQSFAGLQQAVQERGWSGKVDGVLLDLGVSTPQLDDPARGFSFIKDGPLDMRMNPQQGSDAATWLNHAKEKEISDVLFHFGEERYARRIARAIVTAREKQSLTSTRQLSEIIKAAHPAWERRIHPATRSFQAIRIYINRELDDLQHGLEQAVNVLAPEGRLCVISFHSLEDRIVKRAIQKYTRQNDDLPDLPLKAAENQGRLRKVGRLLRPSEAEVAANVRARSARLRIAEKIQ